MDPEFQGLQDGVPGNSGTSLDGINCALAAETMWEIPVFPQIAYGRTWSMFAATIMLQYGEEFSWTAVHHTLDLQYEEKIFNEYGKVREKRAT